MIDKLFKNKKVRYRNLLLVILPFLVLIGIFGFVAMRSAGGMLQGGTSISHSIDTMDYHLRSNATKYQVELFQELTKLTSAEEKDKEAIAMSVVKNFVADFYTWTNKGGSYDVGGMYYVFSPSKGNIITDARDGFYKYVTHYMNEYGSENLLEVDSITIEGGKADDPYEYNGKSYDAYYYTCTWTYVDHEGFNESDYVTKEYFTVIENEDGRFEIVQAYGDF